VLAPGTGGVPVFAIEMARRSTYRTPDWQDELRRSTNGRGVDHVVELGGVGTLDRSIASTGPGGVVSLIGNTGCRPSDRPALHSWYRRSCAA
jgi:NADPH:quinone reductase-like Zn-dependent oxidoreductase